jgi:hypothetical protein
LASALQQLRFVYSIAERLDLGTTFEANKKARQDPSASGKHDIFAFSDTEIDAFLPKALKMSASLLHPPRFAAE